MENANQVVERARMHSPLPRRPAHRHGRPLRRDKLTQDQQAALRELGMEPE